MTREALKLALDLATTPPQRPWAGSGDLEDSNAYQTPPAQPPQRTWVGLTEEYRKQLIHEGWCEYIAGIDDGKTFGEWMSVATEIKLKELNHE
jgi:hypothetical protein